MVKKYKLKKRFSVISFVTPCTITLLLLSMDRGGYYLSFDGQYYNMDSILRKLCIKTAQRP